MMGLKTVTQNFNTNPIYSSHSQICKHNFPKSYHKTISSNLIQLYSCNPKQLKPFTNSNSNSSTHNMEPNYTSS
ncbi:hypothetical protein PRUPE_1G554700 [Prunus persica]|uniref:Uncharacterized protein n=1 Tax=Prunus persica TaxID=3760 RepID=M5XEQ5_PRUPE|nr:hypothetical protein PRUPE_1G554700 [Prunus persica]